VSSLPLQDKFGGLHVLFNNAGIMMSQDDDAVHTTEDVIDTTLAVNVKVGPTNLAFSHFHWKFHRKLPDWNFLFDGNK
jgi:NAD(P)-dependent dehydrogenase (short-subunit alcohol dehydrogenase family)